MDKSINFLKLGDNNNRRFQFPEIVSAAISCKSGKILWLLLGRRYVRSTGKCMYNY